MPAPSGWVLAIVHVSRPMATVEAVISITPSFAALAGAHASIVTPQRPTRFVRTAISGGAIGAGGGSIVWVDAKLPPGTVSRIEAGSAATVVIGGERIAAKVLRSAHRTSDATRSATIRLEVANKEDSLHGGDFVEVYFEATAAANAVDKSATQLSVPTDALVQLEGDTVVFRRSADGALEPVAVRAGEVVGDRTVIREGLKAGDTVVVAGAFAVKSQMLKAQLGEGHAH